MKRTLPNLLGLSALFLGVVGPVACGSMLAVAPAFADPGVTVYYHDELLRVTLNGSYQGAYYLVWRSGTLVGEYSPLSSDYTLCTGDCFLTDNQASPGATYYYRFDLQFPEGRLVSYGPYPVTVPDTPLGALVTPNPSSGAVRIQLSLPGSRRNDIPLQTDARILDLQGRTVRVLYFGALSRGVTSVVWDGHGDTAQQLGAGVYFVRLTTSIGTRITRIVRFR